MLKRLDRAGMRGTVRIVLPSKNDHGAAIWASRFTYAGLLRKRVEIYEYQPTKLHTKLFVIDDMVYIGSANYDIRSLFLNLEMMLRIDDKVVRRACPRLCRRRGRPVRADHAPLYTRRVPTGGSARSRRLPSS